MPYTWAVSYFHDFFPLDTSTETNGNEATYSPVCWPVFWQVYWPYHPPFHPSFYSPFYQPFYWPVHPPMLPRMHQRTENDDAGSKSEPRDPLPTINEETE